MIKKIMENAINVSLSWDEVSEVRFRCGLPLVFEKRGRLFPVLKNGKELVASKDMIERIISEVTENSFYAFEHKFSKGYLDYYGAKIAIVGSGVYKEGELYSLKDISSINVRIPRAVDGISNIISDEIFANGLSSALIIGMTGVGKTTILRDLAKNVYMKNSVVVDERGELDLGCGSLGSNVDVLKDIDKITAINYSIRGLNPDMIFLDELFSREEVLAIMRARRAGISVIASFHGDGFESYIESDIFIKGAFDYLVLLKKERGKGSVEKILLTE